MPKKNSPIQKIAPFQLILLIGLLATFTISVIALNNTLEIKKALPQTIEADEFLEKLTNHEETRALTGISPLNIIEINNQNLQNLQTQIQGLDQSFVGNFLVQYQDNIVIYDYQNDEVKGFVNFNQQNSLPQDFFQKLNTHSELNGLENEQPVGGQLDQPTLTTLQQQFPQVYVNAKVGDYLLRYQSRLIIYDYNADTIVTAVQLS